jgi:hypothetical protein
LDERSIHGDDHTKNDAQNPISQSAPLIYTAQKKYFTKRTIFIHTIKSREGQAEQKVTAARLPRVGQDGMERVEGN